MKYCSTRNSKLNKTFDEIIIEGLASDGGLYMPKSWPKINTNENNEDTNEIIKGYNYLIKMPISQLTMDRKIILEKEVEDLLNKLNKLKSTNIENIWLDELNELLIKWNEHKKIIEDDYNNDKNNLVTKIIKKKSKK